MKLVQLGKESIYDRFESKYELISIEKIEISKRNSVMLSDLANPLIGKRHTNVRQQLTERVNRGSALI